MLGAALPLVAAGISAKVLLEFVALERLGVIAIAWTVVSFMATFDLGLGRSLTALLARISPDALSRSELFWSAFLAQTIASIGVGWALYLSTPYIAKQYVSLASEAEQVLGLLIVVAPFAMTTSSLRAILDAQQKHTIVGIQNLVFGCLTYLAPLAFAASGFGLFEMLASVVLSRVGLWLSLVITCIWQIPRISRPVVQVASFSELAKFSSWIALATGVLGPVLAFADRFVASVHLSGEKAAIYFIGFVLISRLYVLSASMQYVLVPTLSADLVQQSAHIRTTCTHAIRVLLLTVAPLIAALSFAADPLVALFVGAGFHIEAASVLRVLLVGLLLNLLASVPTALLVASGRARLIAVSYVSQLPIYVCALIWGAESPLWLASIWSVRASLDAVYMFRLMNATWGISTRSLFGDLQIAMVAALLLTLTLIAIQTTMALITAGLFVTLVLWAVAIASTRYVRS